MSLPTPIRASAHHGYKSWTSTYWDDQGHHRTKRFGKVSQVTKKQAKAAFEAWRMREFHAKPHVRNPDDPNAYTVEHLAKAYHAHAKTVYRKHGKQTTTMIEVAHAMNWLMKEYGSLPADAIGAPELTRLRDKMIHGGQRKNRPATLSVSTINGRLRIWKQAFGWARQYSYVSATTAYDVSLVKRLRAGRCAATAPVPVVPVPQDVLDATLAVCPQTVKDMIQVLLLTGMRSGELCSMRRCDVKVKNDDEMRRVQGADCITDVHRNSRGSLSFVVSRESGRRDEIWWYIPPTHKTEHHGKTRRIPIGPQAQAILKPYLDRRQLTQPVFTPQEAHRERLEMIGWPKVTAYQMARSTFKPGRAYTNDTFRNAVQRACDRAFDADGARRAAHDWSHRWHPHQLRHNAATRIRAEFGIEAAMDMLGHANVSVTAIYAERAEARLAEIARKAG